MSFTFSRTALLKDEFIAALGVADKVILTPIMGSREVNTYGIRSEDIAEGLSNCVCVQNFDEAVEAERKIGHSILKKCFLSELIPRFEAMKTAGVEPTDRGSSHRFWKEANSFVPGQIPLFFLFESNCNACK